MRRQRRADTGPELLLRRLLHGHGFRYRIHVTVIGLPRRTIDIAFPRERVAVFVDGCYWHGCPDHGTWPATNADWWRAKIEGNRARDRETDDHLTRHEWLVIRLWEHQNAAAAAAIVEEAVRRRRRTSSRPSAARD